jgi:hypothetical protein
MEELKDILWPVMVLGGLGAFIDFLIGKAGQEKARDFLTKWWIRFDDVNWHNFGKEEALFAGEALKKWFGKRTWSFRRIFISATVLVIASICSITINIISNGVRVEFFQKNNLELWWFAYVSWALLDCAILCMSISITILITRLLGRICGDKKNSQFYNLFEFLVSFLWNANWFALNNKRRKSYCLLWNPHHDYILSIWR